MLLRRRKSARIQNALGRRRPARTCFSAGVSVLLGRIASQHPQDSAGASEESSPGKGAARRKPVLMAQVTRKDAKQAPKT